MGFDRWVEHHQYKIPQRSTTTTQNKCFVGGGVTGRRSQFQPWLAQPQHMLRRRRRPQLHRCHAHVHLQIPVQSSRGPHQRPPHHLQPLLRRPSPPRVVDTSGNHAPHTEDPRPVSAPGARLGRPRATSCRRVSVLCPACAGHSRATCVAQRCSPFLDQQSCWL